MTKKVVASACSLCGVGRPRRDIRNGMCQNCRYAYEEGRTAEEQRAKADTSVLDRVTPIGVEIFYDIDQMRKAIESLRMNMLFEEHPAKSDLESYQMQRVTCCSP